MSSVFSHFLSERSFKSRQNPRVDFFSGKKRLRRIQNGVFPFTVVEFCGRWIVYKMTPVYSPRRGRFVNSAFPNKKNLAPKRGLFMTNKFESKCLQKFYVSSKQEKAECYMNTTSYLEEPNRHFCQHFMRRTTQQTFSAINLANQQKTTKLFFSSQVRKQFKLLAGPFKSLRCCLQSDKLVNCHV